MVRLVEAALLDLWQDLKRESTWAATAAKRRMTEIEARKKRLVQAYIYDQAIDRSTYDRELAELDEALTFGQLELRDAELEDFDMEAALGFARHLLTRAYKLWDTATADQKRRLQTLIFPEGVTFDGEALGTPVTFLLFSYLGAVETGREGLVAPGKMVSNTDSAGFTRLEKFLRRVDTFRRSEFAA